MLLARISNVSGCPVFPSTSWPPFKIMPAAALSASQEGERYYLNYREWQEAPGIHKVSTDVIDKRIARFVDFLRQNNLKPGLIDICRSRFSGYTPEDQWQYIENRLIEQLNDLYSLTVTYIGEFDRIYGGCNANSNQ